MAKRVYRIDAETWAESGGSQGIFGNLWRKGKLKIVPAPPDGSRILPPTNAR